MMEAVPLRIAIVGTSGSGKSTLARRIAADRDLPCIELDAINWGPGWANLSRMDPAAFVSRVEAAIAPDGWVVDGNYRIAQPLVLRLATDVVWLDYSRAVVMRRVLARSFSRALRAIELWPGTGNRESWRRWLDAEHPIRWAWDTHAANRARYEVLLCGNNRPNACVHRVRTPTDLSPALARLSARHRR